MSSIVKDKKCSNQKINILQSLNPVAVLSKAWVYLACLDCVFESHQGHGCLSIVSLVWRVVDVSTSRWSLIQRSPIECLRLLTECNLPASIMKRLCPARGWCAIQKSVWFVCRLLGDLWPPIFRCWLIMYGLLGKTVYQVFTGPVTKR